MSNKVPMDDADTCCWESVEQVNLYLLKDGELHACDCGRMWTWDEEAREWFDLDADGDDDE